MEVERTVRSGWCVLALSTAPVSLLFFVCYFHYKLLASLLPNSVPEEKPKIKHKILAHTMFLPSVSMLQAHNENVFWTVFSREKLSLSGAIHNITSTE